MKKWYVIKIKYKQEKIAEENLAAQNFETYNPLVVELKKRKKGNQEIFSPLFGGYMFIRFDIKKDHWRCICGTKGVASLLTATDTWCTSLPKGFVEELQKREDIYGRIPANKLGKVMRKFTNGETVKIIGGAFEGMTGTCVGINAHKVDILIALLNSKFSIKLSNNMVVRVMSGDMALR